METALAIHNPGDGNDTLAGGTGVNRHVINGSEQADTVTFKPDPLIIEATFRGDFNLDGIPDQVQYKGSWFPQFFGNGGNDTFGVDPFPDPADAPRTKFDGGEGNDTATGGQNDDTLEGGNGDDSLNGGGGDDSMNGGAGDDSLEGGDGDDRLSGGPAPVSVVVNQQIAPSHFSDLGAAWEDLGHFNIAGGMLVVRLGDSSADHSVIADAIRIERTDVSSAALIIDDGDAGFNAPGWITITGQGFGSDIKSSSAGSGNTASWSFGGLPSGTYRVSATWTPDSDRAANAPYIVFAGADDNDSLYGGAGNDTYLLNADVSLGTYTINDSINGLDTLDFSQTLNTPVTVDLSTTVPQNVNANLVLTLTDGESIENLYGGQAGDTLIGNNQHNFIAGNDGDDTIDGGLGGDTIDGGDGDDDITGGPEARNFVGVKGSHTLVIFQESGAVQTVTVTDLQEGESILGINNVRIITDKGNIYRIEPATGKATLEQENNLLIGGTGFGFSTAGDPTGAGALARLEGDTATPANAVHLEISIPGGIVTEFPAPAYAAGDTNFGQSVNLAAMEYLRNSEIFPTGKIIIDSGLDILARQDLETGALTTIGPLGVDTSHRAGLFVGDIFDPGLFAVLEVDGISRLYTIDLDTGAATHVRDLGIDNVHTLTTWYDDDLFTAVADDDSDTTAGGGGTDRQAIDLEGIPTTLTFNGQDVTLEISGMGTKTYQNVELFEFANAGSFSVELDAGAADGFSNSFAILTSPDVPDAVDLIVNGAAIRLRSPSVDFITVIGNDDDDALVLSGIGAQRHHHLRRRRR